MELAAGAERGQFWRVSLSAPAFMLGFLPNFMHYGAWKIDAIEKVQKLKRAFHLTGGAPLLDGQRRLRASDVYLLAISSSTPVLAGEICLPQDQEDVDLFSQ